MKSLRFISFCASFVVSLTFPIASAFRPYTVGTGYLEIASAILLVILAIVIYVRKSSHRWKGSRKTMIQLYKFIFTIPLALSILYVLNLPIHWDVLLTGLSWRFWLLSLVLEDLVHLYRAVRHRKLDGNYQY